MSDGSPLIFHITTPIKMFKKPKKVSQQSRRKVLDSDDEGGNEEKCQDAASVVTVTDGISRLSQDTSHEENDEEPAQVVKTSSVKTSSMKLSFEHDDEDGEEEVKVKKSSFSRRMAKQLERDRKKRAKELEEKEIQRKELEKRTQSSKSTEKQEVDVIFINADKVKKDVEEVIQIPDEDHFSDDSEPEEEAPSALKFRTVLERGSIPDAHTIFALKKQRHSRKHAEEFIALSDGLGSRRDLESETDESDFVGNRKRDQYDMEFDDEEEERIEFDELKSAERDREKARQAIEEQESQNLSTSKKGGVTGSDNDSDSDDEMSRWEKEQIMKGVGTGNVAQMKAKVEAELNGNLMEVSSSPCHSPLLDTFSKAPTSRSLPSYLNDSFNMVSVDDVLDMIQELVDEKREKISYLDRQLTDLSVEEKVLQEDLERMEVKEKELESRRKELHEKLKSIDLDSQEETS